MSTQTTSADYRKARDILGDDFITPEEISAKYDMTYSHEQLKILRGSIPSEDILVWCRDNNYVLVAGPSRSIELLSLHRSLNRCFRDIPEVYYTEEHGWRIQNKDRFLKVQAPKPIWVTLRKEIVPNSIGKIFRDQVELLSDLEYVPNDSEVEWVVKIYNAIRNTKLFDGYCVMTSKRGTLSNRHMYFLGDRFTEIEDRFTHDNLGITFARKL
ncbi:MAG: hypothetical protein HOE19_01225 [Candidatus Komeilibacteria bacterium]|jgi:hypothetical protein|nr:hypothetical protein [Candidatus Komeilibacteria bacterium]MBT4447555.1 hypothetical protein [Candidatus Komeilibacteria bacterium]